MGRTYRRGDPRKDAARRRTQQQRQQQNVSASTYARLAFERDRMNHPDKVVYDDKLGRYVTSWDELSREGKRKYIEEVGG